MSGYFSSHVEVLRKQSYSFSFVLLLSGFSTWLAGAPPLIGSPAGAAEVNAIGAPAPVGFADVIERVKSAVVGVRVRIEATSRFSEALQDRPRSPGPQSSEPPPESGTVLGSGFFISGDGYVVTNNHVVANGTGFEITTESGKSYQAQVIGTDPQTDLALIKVSARTDFPYVRLASDVPRIGDWVLAVGNPFGLGGTVTAGIVSARGRDIGETPYDDFIQIDAPVNEGNSGGPTFNVKGEVIGVNTAIYSPSGGSVGIAFDIPIETVNFVVRQLKDKGHVTRGWIGVQIQSVSPAIAEAIGSKNTEGALVAQVEPHSPAAKAGLEVGDVIISVSGEGVKDSRELGRKIAAIAPGSMTKFGIFRDGEEKTITMVVGKFPETSAEAKAERQSATSEIPALGVTAAPASDTMGAGDRGVLITNINPTGHAAESGLQTGDVILDVGRRAVSTPADVRKMVDEARTLSKRVVLLRIRRGDAVRFVAVPIA